MYILRQYIRAMLEELHEHSNYRLYLDAHARGDDDGKKEPPEDLLTEPDLPESETYEQEEQNVVANIAGVTTPLGTGPTYPVGRKKRRRRS